MAGATRSAGLNGNLRGSLWLIGDMTLVVSMLSIVKAMGQTYPAVQIVFIRCLVGLVVIAPLIWRGRHQLFATGRMPMHLLRVGCNAIALTANFTAVTSLPLALVTAIAFTRPMILMFMAGVFLGERIGLRRWMVAAVGFGGVLVAARPDEVPLTLGLAAAFLAALFGSGAVVATRKLKGESHVVLMAFYTIALTAVTAIPAAILWQPVAFADIGPLIAVGVLAQVAQLFFLRAHHTADARTLAPLGYLHLVLAVLAGLLLFNEVPTNSTLIGGAVIVAAAIATTMMRDPPAGAR